MTKVFWLIEVNDEELVPKIRQVLSMEVLFWILSLILALAHVCLQSTTDWHFGHILRSSNFTTAEPMPETALGKEAHMPARTLPQGFGGTVFAGVVAFIGMVGVSGCLVQSVRGFRVLGADGGPGGLRPVFYCEMIGATMTILMIITAIQTGLWYSEASNWANGSDPVQFCQTSLNSTSANGTSANGTSVNGTSVNESIDACKAAARETASLFEVVGTFYFAFIAGLVPIIFLCGCSARTIFKLSPNMMIATGSMEAAVQRVRRSSIDAPVIGGVIRRMSHSHGNRHSTRTSERQNDYALPQTMGKEAQRS